MSILSLNDILKNEILESLQGSDAILVKAVMDLTSQVKIGANQVTVPSVTGLSLQDITSGSKASASGMTSSGTILALDKVKSIPEYISYANGKDSALDLKSAYLSVAPKVFQQGIEIAIATELATASANDFNSGIANSFTLANIAHAKKLLDAARVPKMDRYLVVNSAGMEILASFDNFVQAQQSLSPEALRQGIVSVVKGFNVIQSEEVADTKIHCFHKSAVAFALHSQVEFVEQMEEAYNQEYIALRGKFGCKAMENASGAGLRKLTITMHV